MTDPCVTLVIGSTLGGCMLGQGVCKAIPSCAIWAIRNAYPELGNIFVCSFQKMMSYMT